MIKDYSNLTNRIYTQLSPELSQEFHNMLTDMAQEISRLYEIENAKPSIAVHRLEYICKILYEKSIDIKWLFKNDYNIIKQALITKSKKEQAFDIIKEKCVDVGYVVMSFVYRDYNSKMDELWGDKAPSYYLTEEEFKLLKEVLNNE